MDKARILVVDDDDITRSFLVDILTADGFDVEAAPDGQAAIESLRERVPDLVLSDVLMPQVSGLDLFKKIQADERFQNLPVVFLTSLDDGDTLIDLKELGPDDYIQKPVRPRHLLATVRGKLRRKQRLDEHAERERDRLRDRIRWTLSHELRTPLTIIQGISELLLNDGPLPQATDYQDLLQSLRSQSFQLGSLIENFLLVTRIDSGVEEDNCKRATACPLGEAIEEAAFNWMERARARGVRFEVEAADDLPAVHVYRPHLLEVLRQALDNAFKFADPASPAVKLVASAEGTRGRVTVHDNGPGIPASKMEVLFQKLSQVDRELHEQQGSGLGLYIAKRLIDLNRGEIKLQSEPGQGTEVQLWLPTQPPEPAPGPAA